MNQGTALLVSQVLDLLISGVVVSAKALTSTKQMVEEGRDPTQEEWDELNVMLAEYRRRLHSDGPDGAIDGIPI